MVQVSRIPASPIRYVVKPMLVAAAVAWMAPGAVQAGNADPWQVTEIEGRAWINHADEGWRALKAGATLHAGDRAETGMNGRIVLARPGDSLAVSPNTRFRIPGPKQMGPKAHIVQTLGTLRFTITRRAGDVFKVRTPFLAASTKGTAFTVTVGDGKSSISVTEGAVRAISTLSGESVILRSGTSATFDSAADGGIYPVKRTGNAGSADRPATPAVKPAQEMRTAPRRQSQNYAAFARRCAQPLFAGAAIKLAGFDPGTAHARGYRLAALAGGAK